MFYFLTKSKEYTVYLSYDEVTTSFKKIGLTQNSVQVAKLTITVQYLQGKKKTKQNNKQPTMLRRHHLLVPKPNWTNKKVWNKTLRKASNINYCP